MTLQQTLKTRFVYYLLLRIQTSKVYNNRQNSHKPIKNIVQSETHIQQKIAPIFFSVANSLFVVLGLFLFSTFFSISLRLSNSYARRQMLYNYIKLLFFFVVSVQTCTKQRTNLEPLISMNESIWK